MFEGKALRDKLKAGRVCLGMFTLSSDPAISELLSGSGFDFLIIDAEHGALSIESIQTNLMAVKGSDTVPMVRVPSHDHVFIKRVLDAGAGGILIPQPRSAEEVRQGVSACLYPPDGNRGVGPRRPSNYYRDLAECTRTANQHIVIWAQIEHVDAIADIEQIVRVARLDGADIPYMLHRGLTVAHTPGQFSGIALAEHAMFFMLWFAKKYPECVARMRSETFYGPATEELHSATLGVIGLGASGRELALRASVFGMRVVAIDVVDVPSDLLRELGVSYFGKPTDLERVLSESDYVSLHVPLTSDTRHLIGRRELERMKRTAVLVNVARGELVDEPALIEALRSGQILGAGLDVFATEPLPADHPLLQMDNVLATPHNGGGSRGTSRRRGSAAAENLDRVARGLPPLHQVG